MSTKTMPAHRDYPDPEATERGDAEPSYNKIEPSYDGLDAAYDEIDAEEDNAGEVDRDIFNLWSGDQADAFPAITADAFPALPGDVFPAIAGDAFPETLFDDMPPAKPTKAGPGHGDS